MNPEALVRAIEDCDLTPRSYSGRGMYGRKCVGVTIDRDSDWTPFALGAELALLLGDEVRDLRSCMDGMGLDTILYFPNAPWPSGREESEED